MGLLLAHSLCHAKQSRRRRLLLSCAWARVHTRPGPGHQSLARAPETAAWCGWTISLTTRISTRRRPSCPHGDACATARARPPACRLPSAASDAECHLELRLPLASSMLQDCGSRPGSERGKWAPQGGGPRSSGSNAPSSGCHAHGPSIHPAISGGKRVGGVLVQTEGRLAEGRPRWGKMRPTRL